MPRKSKMAHLKQCKRCECIYKTPFKYSDFCLDCIEGRWKGQIQRLLEAKLGG